MEPRKESPIPVNPTIENITIIIPQRVFCRGRAFNIIAPIITNIPATIGMDKNQPLIIPTIMPPIIPPILSCIED